MNDVISLRQRCIGCGAEEIRIFSLPAGWRKTTFIEHHCRKPHLYIQLTRPEEKAPPEV